MPRTVLSVQSHVAFGHVGNAAAVFPLQRLGLEVWAVHTCQLSNHTGYPGVEGEVFAADHVRAVLRGLEARGALAGLAGVLTGWLGRPEVGEAVLWALDRAGPDALFVCDPVMGDDTPEGTERLYAAAGIPDFFRDHLVPRAAVVTPNRFELSLLSGLPVRDLDEAVAAARVVLARGPRLVVATSLPGADGDAASGEVIRCLAVTAEQAWLVASPRLTFATPPNGAGDVLAALLMAHLLRGAGPDEALALAVAGLHGVLRRTRAEGTREMQLVAAQDALVAPQQTFPAQRLPGGGDVTAGPG